jgi:hypothetical protein
MACDITAGRLEPCKNTIGGLKNVYFINYAGEAPFTILNGEVTAIDTITVTAAYKYELRADGNTFEEAFASDKNTGVTLFTQSLNLVLKKQDTQTHNEVRLLANGRPQVVVEDRNGNFMLAGLSEGMDVTGGSIVTGGAKADFNGYNLTFTAEEKEPSPFLDSASITSLEGIAVAGV